MPKKKVLLDVDENAEVDALDVDGNEDDGSVGPSIPKAAPKAATNGKLKSASETYTKVHLVAFWFLIRMKQFPAF